MAGSNTFAVAAGQTLNLGAANFYTLNIGLAFSNSGTISVPMGSVSLAASNLTYAGGTFSAASGGTLSLASALSTGTYSPAAAGTVVLSNSYSGLLANLAPASGGTLVIANNLTAGTLNVVNGAYVATNAASFGPTTLSLNGGSLGAIGGPVSVANPLLWANPSGGTLNFAGASLLTLSASLGLTSGTYNLNDPGGHGALAGVVSGPGALNVTGNPTLAGANTYQGGTTFNANTNVTITNNQAFGTGPLTFSNGGFNATTPLTGANAVANAWTISAGQAAYFNGTSAIQLSASTSLSGTETVHVANNLTATLSGLISGTGALVRGQDNFNPGGTLVIDNPANNFSGGFTLSTQGNTVDVYGASTTGVAGAVTNGPLGTGTITIGTANNGNIGLNNSSPTAVTLANNVNLFEDCGFNSPAGLTFSGPAALTTGNPVYNFWIGANSNTQFSGVISGGTKGINLRQGTGTGGLTLSALNTYTGPTSITMGTLIAGNNVSIGSPGAFGQASSAVTIGDGNSGVNPAALLIGGAWDISRPVTVNANAGPTTLGGSTSATSTFGYNAPQVITLNKSVTLSSAAGGSVWFYDTINGSGTAGITAASAPSGNVTLSPSGANGYSGATGVTGGQLTLDYTSLAFPGTPVVNPASSLTLGGGTLTFNGDFSNPVNQGFAATTVAGFGSAVTVSNGGQPVNVTLAGITRSGGVLDLPVNAASFTTTNSNLNNNNILGGYLTVNGYTDWAANDGSDNIVPLASYDANFASPGNNVDVSSLTPGLSGPTTINSLRFNTAPAGNLNLSGQTLTLQSGGILVTPTSAANGITGGALTASGSTASNTLADVVVIQGNTGAAFTIGAAIVNNGTISVGLTKGGPGKLILTGSNTYSGPTTISLGTLQGSVGGGSFPATTSFSVNAGANLTFNETGPVAWTNPVTGPGSFTLAGNGSLTISGSNFAYTGATAINGGHLTLLNTATLPTSSVTVGSGATFNPQGVRNFGSAPLSVLGGTLDLATGLAGQLTAGNISLSAASLNVTAGANTALTGNAISVSGVNTVNVLGGYSPGTYTLISAASLNMNAGSSFVLGKTGFGSVTPLLTPTAYEVTVNSINPTPLTPYWYGGVSTVWNDASQAPPRAIGAAMRRVRRTPSRSPAPSAPCTSRASTAARASRPRWGPTPASPA